MSGLDIAARGLAGKALATTTALQAGAGAAILKHQRGEAGAIVQPVSAILDRLDVSPAGFGALYDAATSDYSALQAFTAAMSSAAQGMVRLDARTIAVGQTSSTERLNWAQSNAGMVGAGIDRTIIRNLTTTASSASLGFSGSCENAVFSDMTFHGRVVNAGATLLRSIVFNRCKFTTDPTVLQNAFQLNPGAMSGGIEFLFFIDCIFQNAGRMNCEITNNVADTVVRYANLYFIRPRFIGAGQASSAVGMGLSVSGYGDNVVLDRPWFDGNKLVHLENVGCSRLKVRDMAVRQSTHPTGRNCVSFSNTRPMHDCEIDGFQLVGDVLANLAERPAVDAAIINIQANAKRLRLTRIKAAIDNAAVATGVIEFSAASNEDATIEHCDLWSNSNKNVIGLTNTTGNHVVRNNILTSTHAARTAPFVAAWGSGTVHVSQNRFSYASGTAASLFVKSGAGALNVAHDNIGITTRYRATHTIAAGSVASTLAAHGLPGTPTSIRACALADCGGSVWATATSTNIQANIGRVAKTTVLTGSKTYDAASLADGAATSTTVTVTGAALGDVVDGIGLGVSSAALTVTGMVTAANTVTVVLFNKSGAAVDLASTTLTVSVRKVAATSVTVDVEAEYAW